MQKPSDAHLIELQAITKIYGSGDAEVREMLQLLGV